MSRLSTAQEFTIVMAARLVERHGEVLSAFEAELVAQVGRRWLASRAEAAVTDVEWPVIEFAAQALADAARVDPKVERLRA
jgi:hypothetical protein